MENIKIWIDGVQKEVFGLFYIFNSKYYFIYTEKEIDENGYVVLYMTTVGKETKNTENGAIETGAMIAMEIANSEDQQQAQTSVSYIVEDKKNNTKNSQIQYLPMSMLNELKIISKKRFRLLKSIMEENFKLTFDTISTPINDIVEIQPIAPIDPIAPANQEQVAQPLNQVLTPVQSEQIVQQAIIETPPVVSTTPVQLEPIAQSVPTSTQPEPQSVQTPIQHSETVNNIEENVIIDYRSKYFEEQEKNKELQLQIDDLTQKLEEIKKVIN